MHFGYGNRPCLRCLLNCTANFLCNVLQNIDHNRVSELFVCLVGTFGNFIAIRVTHNSGTFSRVESAGSSVDQVASRFGKNATTIRRKSNCNALGAINPLTLATFIDGSKSYGFFAVNIICFAVVVCIRTVNIKVFYIDDLASVKGETYRLRIADNQKGFCDRLTLHVMIVCAVLFYLFYSFC